MAVYRIKKGSRRESSRFVLYLPNHIKETEKKRTMVRFLNQFLSINQNKIGIGKFPDLIASNIETLTHYFVYCRDWPIVIWHASSTLDLQNSILQRNEGAVALGVQDRLRPPCEMFILARDTSVTRRTRWAVA